ncbi:ATP-binding protein [Actinoallomurus sp. NPDC050550]|uniref:sensor histidine kinase n=1 Tax=Actinoallomurus sp. NPDC050550 TaxID=3154937 RepID=UPI00340A5459
MISAQARSSPPNPSALVGCVAKPESPPRDTETGDPALWRRRIRHDIRHELGTIIMLASAVAVSDDIGPASRERVEALLGETRWLDHLLRQLDAEEEGQVPVGPERVRVDRLVGEIAAGLRLSSPRRIGFAGGPAWAHIDPLALWRAVRNVLDNAHRIARERVEVLVSVESGWTVVQVDDDGPGFGAGTSGLASLGLGIVNDLVSEYGGMIEMRSCELGGARVRILLPAADRP